MEVMFLAQGHEQKFGIRVLNQHIDEMLAMRLSQKQRKLTCNTNHEIVGGKVFLAFNF
jgi:hypothetical protein